ncbi:hypothetical protein Hanom_Chr00s137495g01817851 [Helianthus anomalus]
MQLLILITSTIINPITRSTSVYAHFHLCQLHGKIYFVYMPKIYRLVDHHLLKKIRVS